MSIHTEHSAWSPDEVDSLENIDQEIQLVSTSTETHTHSNDIQENGSEGHKKIISNLKNEDVPRQSNLNIFQSKSYDNLQAIKCHNSCDDLCSLRQVKKLSFIFYDNKNAEVPGNLANTFLNNRSTRISTHERDYTQSRMKDNASNSAVKITETLTKNTMLSEAINKQNYLKQINEQLTKELDEKNAILSLLQENYERLLFKYAEAQNRIDELRIKFLAEKTESTGFQTKYEVLNNHVPQIISEEHSAKTDVKCQKAIITSLVNRDGPRISPNENIAPPISRPSSLPLECTLKFDERDLLKATTPTDSEGLSSIITSMSGHSKILNSLDEENRINKRSNFFKYKKNNILLQENIMSNDPFDKVKNWQNSLPPLEQIETPETTLYNINNTYSSNDTNYKEISSPKIENDCAFSEESCPPSWREETHTCNRMCEIDRNKVSPQRASVNESHFYSKKLQSSAREKEHFHEGTLSLKDKSPSRNNISSTCIIQRRQKRPPLLRCSSLPPSDYDSIKLGNSKSEIYIPPLDLNNVTLSDDESYCQQDYYISKTNGATSSSIMSSREGSINRTNQTPPSFSSCKATISEERVPRQTVSKSTSITPDRTKTMDMSFTNRDCTKFNVTSNLTFVNECNECCNDKSINLCNVCGEFISEGKSNRFFGSRSNSCESFCNRDAPLKEPLGRRTKPPFKRSVSFGSETNTSRYCPHEKQVSRDYFSGLNEDSVENFEVYANNLKARSQVVIKALTAHVNFS